MSTHPSFDSAPSLGQNPAAHDWHSAAYVEQWITMKETTAAEREAQFALLADHLPYPREAAIHFLDVGAGWGPLTTSLLDRFPAARATLVDYSDVMATQARMRLVSYGARVRYIVADLTQAGTLVSLTEDAGPFDAIVSCCCFHNIDPVARVRALYREAREALTAGGVFLDLDTVGTDEPIIHGITHHARVEQRRDRVLKETGTLPTHAEIDRELRARQQDHFEGSHGAFPEHRSLADHLSWLQEAGFDAAETFWRQGSNMLVGGYVAASAHATP